MEHDHKVKKKVLSLCFCGWVRLQRAHATMPGDLRQQQCSEYVGSRWRAR